MTTIEPDELLVSLRVPVSTRRSGFAIEEIARRPGDFALIGAIAIVALGDDDQIADARVVMFGVAARPVRADRPRGGGLGPPGSPQHELEAISRAVAAALTPPNDVQATATYRRDVAGFLAARVVRSAGRAPGLSRSRREADDEKVCFDDRHGVPYEHDIEPRLTLADFLRDRL